MNVDDDLALACRLDREINPRRTRSTRRRTQEEQAMAHSTKPHPRSSEPTHTKRQKPGYSLDGVQAAVYPSVAANVSGDSNSNRRSVSTAAQVQLAPVAPELVDSANRPVPTFTWPGSDADFPCLPEPETGGQRLLWEAELIGSYVMLPCANLSHDPPSCLVPVCLRHQYAGSILSFGAEEASGRLQPQIGRLCNGRTNI